MANSKILLNDGASRILLNDGVSLVLLNVTDGGGAVVGEGLTKSLRLQPARLVSS